MNDIILSVIIPARNEFPNVVHTCYSILHSWESSGYDPKQIEIIIVDNCSTDHYQNDVRKPGDKGTVTYLMSRGAYWSRTIRVLYDPLPGNHSARNKGAEIARGKYLFFSDAHMAYCPQFFKHILKAVDESGGIVHAPIGWMGAYPPHESGLGYQYSLKLGEEIKGTWNNYAVDLDKWFYIPALGHCSLAVRRDQFIDFGGYPKIHRTYGGGEFYLNMKWWMFGSSVAVEPKAIGYHLASSRGYNYDHNDYIHNVANIGMALGMDDWVERYYLNNLRKIHKTKLDEIWAEAERETQKDKEFIRQRKVMSFNDMLKDLPWDKKNDERLGKHFSGLTIFHDSWLNIIKDNPVVMEAYNNSKHQKELDEFIRTNLTKYIYKK